MSKKKEISINQADEVQFSTEKEYIEEIISKVENKKIYIDPRYQRRNSWTDANRLSFIDSIYKNMVSHSIILVNIGASYFISLQNKREKDAEYFKELMDQGYQYVSIDGNNRSQTMVRYKNGELGVSYSHDKDKSKFLKKKLSLTTYSSMSLLQMHELGIKVNQGQPWNRQEQRNCINSKIADFIRDTSQKLDKITDFIKLKKSRMFDDEFIAMLLFYQTTGKGGDQKNWDSMYKDETGDLSNFGVIIKEWAKVIKENPTTKKFGKSFVYNLYIFISYLHKNNIFITKENYRNFLNIFHEQEILRSREKRALYKVNGEEKTWSLLCRTVTKNIDIKLEKIIQDFNPYLSTYTVQKDIKRSFSFTDKVDLWVRNEGIVRINGEVEGKWYKEGDTHQYINLLEALDGEKYVVDHVLPHKDGNKTILENGEITTREYNLWKSARIPSYVI